MLSGRFLRILLRIFAPVTQVCCQQPILSMIALSCHRYRTRKTARGCSWAPHIWRNSNPFNGHSSVGQGSCWCCRIPSFLWSEIVSDGMSCFRESTAASSNTCVASEYVRDEFERTPYGNGPKAQILFQARESDGLESNKIGQKQTHIINFRIPAFKTSDFIPYTCLPDSRFFYRFTADVRSYCLRPWLLYSKPPPNKWYFRVRDLRYPLEENFKFCSPPSSHQL